MEESYDEERSFFCAIVQRRARPRQPQEKNEYTKRTQLEEAVSTHNDAY